MRKHEARGKVKKL